MHSYIVAFFLLSLSCVVCSSPVNATSISTLTFANNNKTVHLEPQKIQKKSIDGYRYFLDSEYLGPRKSNFGVANKLIVVGDHNLSSINWKEVIDAQEVRVIAQFEKLWVVSIQLSDWRLQEAMDKVAKIQSVINVQPDLLQLRYYKIDEPDLENGNFHESRHNTEKNVATKSSVDKQLKRITLDKRAEEGTQTSGRNQGIGTVRIALIDDGFNLSHPALSEANVIFQYDISSGKLDSSPHSDEDFHGTMGLSLLQAKSWLNVPKGLVPEAELITIRLVKAQTSQMVLAAFIARSMGADIINLSWNLRYLPEALKAVLEYRDASDIPPFVVTSAGNKGKNACTENQLSQISTVIVVGSRNQDGHPLPFSNYGKCIDLYAPQGFTTAAVDGKTETQFEGSSASAFWFTGILGLRYGELKSPISTEELLLQLKNAN